ncbi:MAG: PAS domain S-box protein [Syntrophales bacterium]|jgi:PAS domain S-box-containing protein|nr:PAS domain S-box protein [Syntrophales bacterium]
MRSRFTIRKALTLNFILVAILPLALVGAIALQIFSRTMEQDISNRNIQIALALSGEIDRFIAEPLRVLALVNDRTGYTRQGVNPDDFLRLLQGRFDVFERIELVDRQGRIGYTGPLQKERINTDISGQPFFREALATGQVVFSDTFPSLFTGLPTIAVALPGKETVAIGYINLAALKGIINKVSIGKKGYAVVFDRLGNIIAHPEQRLVDERVNIKQVEPVRRALNGETGTFPYSFQNQQKIGSTAIAYATGWGVLIAQSEEDAFGKIAEIRTIYLTSMAVTIILALLLAALVLKKPLRSVSGLVAAAGKIAEGDYRLEDVPPSYPEIDLLVDGFKGMVEEIANRENALLKTEERYRNLVEGSFDGIFVQKGLKIIFVNHRFCEMLGYEENELLGEEHWRIYAPEYREITKERAIARLKGEVVTPRYEVKLLRKDGSSFAGEISARVIKIENKPGIQVWVRDLSEQKRVEAQQALSEQRFGDLYNAVSDFVMTQDLQGRFLSVNRAMCDALGFSRQEFINSQVSDFMKPEMVPLFEAEYLCNLKEHGHYEGTAAYFTKDKRKIYLEYKSDLIRPPQGKPFISGIARDVTERILAGRAIRKSEENMRAVLDASPNPIVAYDPVGRVRFINRAFTNIFGWTLDDLQGKPIPFVPDDQRDKTEGPIRELFSRKEPAPITMETTRLTKDGTILDIYVSAALILDSKGEPAGMVVSLSDITQKKKMEANLQQAQKMEAIGLLAGGIAHDFNNMLMGIQGNVSLALLNVGLDDRLRRNIENIEALVGRGASLTRQLLGFARGGKYEVKQHDFSEILKEEGELFGDTRKDIVIEIKSAPDLWKVEADRSQMEQVLMNLFVNAGQAMPTGGHLYLNAGNVIIDDNFVRPFDIRTGRYVMFSVMDTGQGMDEATKKRIFEPFFTTRERGEGTGLGLASVYGIIKNHGGFINVYSETGKGTSFNIYLPASNSGTAKIEPASGREAGLIRGEGTILLVDDEQMILDVGKVMLEAMGYKVFTAAGGSEAIAKFTAVKNGVGEVEKIDLVIQDMIMPEMGGGAVFDRLKEIEPNVQVLLSSGYSINGQAKEILARGCRGFLQKPFSMEALSRKVSEVMKAP